MKVIHKLNKTVVSKNAKNVSFLLANKLGGYCLMGESPSSKYEGVFLMDKEEMFKIIDEIKLVSAPAIKEIVNEFSEVSRDRGTIKENFFLPYGYDALVYELSKEGEIEVMLDARKSYENPGLGRAYKISKLDSGVLVSYKHEKTRLYVVIKSESNDYKNIGEWIKREYEKDKQRQVDFVKYVYRALSMKGKRFVFAFSRSKDQAIREADYVSRNLDRLKEHQKIYVSKINTKLARIPALRLAKKGAVNSLSKLTLNLGNKRGILAGYPWFFQFWSRDELISLKGLLANKQDREVKKILLKNLNSMKNGKIPNITMPQGKNNNADSIGWLFKRVEDCLELFSSKERAMIKRTLISAIQASDVKDWLVYSKAKETWMDTEWGWDNRSGYRIEIQALYLNMLHLAYTLTNDKQYMEKAIKTKMLVRERFWNGKILADGLNDFTARPNAFIAAYIYPELLSNKEWEVCFDSLLKKLWLRWGGIATIDKNNALFCAEHSGEIPRSYHRGDSWFWVNNLAALVMARVNKNKFSKQINKIKEASAKEILFSGAIGNAAELSSASGLQSQGCVSQAWSSALFIELMEEV